METALDPEPRFDIDASAGHMSLTNPRLKVTRIGIGDVERELMMAERDIAYCGFKNSIAQ